MSPSFFAVLQVQHDRVLNPNLLETIHVDKATHDARLRKLTPFGASRQVYLIINGPEDELWLRRLATAENVQREESNADHGHTFADTLYAMRMQRDSVEKKILPVRLVEYITANPKTKITNPVTGLRWKNGDPLPYQDKTVRLYHKEEVELWDSMSYSQRAEVYGKPKDTEAKTAKALGVDIHTTEGLLAVQEKLMATQYKEAPRRTLSNFLQYECSLVVTSKETRDSIQVSFSFMMAVVQDGVDPFRLSLTCTASLCNVHVSSSTHCTDIALQGGRQPIYMRWVMKAPKDVFDLLQRFWTDVQNNTLADYSSPTWTPGTRVVSACNNEVVV